MCWFTYRNRPSDSNVKLIGHVCLQTQTLASLCVTPVIQCLSVDLFTPSADPHLRNAFSTACLCIWCVLLTCGSLGAAADVGVLSVLTGASVPARLAQTLVDVGLTQPPGEPGLAVAAEGGQAVDAGAVVARVGVTLVDVRLTVPPSVT